MKLSEIARRRLHNQQIIDSKASFPEKLLAWMGPMQAQDYNMVKWALGVRLPGTNLKSIEQAIENGQIIRTHLLRPTWHFVAARDVRWILELTSPRIRVAMRSSEKRLGLTKDVISKSNSLIEKILTKNDQMTRSELVKELEKAGFKNEGNLASLLFLNAEMDGIICSGPTVGNNYTYALFEKRVPSAPKMNRNESLARLAKIYFKSHGPATLEDFTWWSGLTKTGAREALEFVKDDLGSEEIDSQTYWFSDSDDNSIKTKQTVQLLPSYDEYLISYKDRSSAIRIEDKKKAISNNGIFRPIIVVNGAVIGIWKRSVQGGEVLVEPKFFSNPSKRIVTLVEKAAESFADFLGKILKVHHIIDS